MKKRTRPKLRNSKKMYSKLEIAAFRERRKSQRARRRGVSDAESAPACTTVEQDRDYVLGHEALLKELSDEKLYLKIQERLQSASALKDRIGAEGFDWDESEAGSFEEFFSSGNFEFAREEKRFPWEQVWTALEVAGIFVAMGFVTQTLFNLESEMLHAYLMSVTLLAVCTGLVAYVSICICAARFRDVAHTTLCNEVIASC